jgi:hypothetical protein
MTTAVVVTSIVTTNLGEARFVDHVLEQVRRNDRDLLNKISAVDMDARVVTAILNVNEFMSYAHEWLRQRQDEKSIEPVLPEQTNGVMKAMNGKTTSKPTVAKKTGATSKKSNKTLVVSENMNEGEFMDYTLERMEEKHIGEDFSEQPFLY